jgi:hypothetical protein
VFDGTMTCNDGGDGDNVVGIGSVAHAEEETKRDDGEQPDHLIQFLRYVHTSDTHEHLTRRMARLHAPIANERRHGASCGYRSFDDQNKRGKPALGGLMEVLHEFFAVIVAKERIENLCHLHGRAADRSRENVAGFRTIHENPRNIGGVESPVTFRRARPFENKPGVREQFESLKETVRAQWHQ